MLKKEEGFLPKDGILAGNPHLCAMDEPFDIPVHYRGSELLFPARLLQLGYTHKFGVEVHGQEVFFEPDEEGGYRALVDPSQLEGSHKIDVALLQAIAGAIEDILK